jgi:hypothetical protein
MNVRENWWAAMVCLLAVSWSTQAQAADCPPTFAPFVAGTPTETGLNEISGLAASRNSPGVLWAINDSGPPDLYAITVTGAVVARFALLGAGLVDWEDIAIGPGPLPGTDYLYIGDVGNNLLARSVVRVYRVPEPVVNVAQPFTDSALMDVEAIDLAYPSGAHDCESLVVTPDTGDLYLITKDTTGVDSGYSFIYRNAAPLGAGMTVPLQEVGHFFAGTNFFNLVTAADLSPDGSGLLMRSYIDVLYWPVAFGQALEDALMAPPCMLPAAPEIQSESIAFAGDMQGFFTVGEWFQGQPQPIYYSELAPWEPETDPTCGNAMGGLYEVGDRLCLRIPDALNPQAPYQWRRDGQALVSGQRIAGALSRSLVILPLTVADSGAYTCTYASASKAEETFGPVQVVVATQLPLSGVAGVALLSLLLAVLGGYALNRRTSKNPSAV